MEELNKSKKIGTICMIIGCFFFGIILEAIAIYQFNKCAKIARKKEEINSIKRRILLSWFLFSFTASTSIFSTSYDVLVGIATATMITLIVYFVKVKNIK